MEDEKMPWNDTEAPKQRLNLIRTIKLGRTSVSAAARAFGVSRQCAYKWLGLYDLHGEAGLIDRSRVPKVPAHRYDQAVYDSIREIKLANMRWGARKILDALRASAPNQQWPSHTQVYRFLKSQGLVAPRRRRQRLALTNPLAHAEDCNDVWQIDFKGWFLTADGTKCEAFTITDAVSRFAICCTHVKSTSYEDVWPLVELSFQKYGLPRKIRSDNGPPFATTGAGRLSRFGVSLIKAGVVPEWITPGKPQENGRHERFHRTLKEETASPPAKNLIQQQRRFQEFIRHYNCKRPHEALGGKRPSDVYTPSPREWDGVFRNPDYDRSKGPICRCRASGQIKLRGADIHVSRALRGEFLQVRTCSGTQKLYYGNLFLGDINGNQLVVPRRDVRKKKNRLV